MPQFVDNDITISYFFKPVTFALFFCSLRLTFFVRRKDGSIIKGVDIVHLLNDKLDDNIILSYPIVSLDTVGEFIFLWPLTTVKLDNNVMLTVLAAQLSPLILCVS